MNRIALVTARSRVLLGSILALALLVPVLPPAKPALAANFLVNSLLDEARDPAALPGVCQSTPSGLCTLRTAIQTANALGGPDVIVVPAGTYNLILARNSCGGEETDACGDLDIFDTVTIQGAGAATTIVDATLINDRVFDVFAPSVTITGLTIRGGNTTSADEDGGGIRVNPGSAPLVLGGPIAATDGLVVTGNTAGQTGGGVAGLFTSFSLNNVTVSTNRANGFGGGGIIATGTPINMTNSSVTGNIQAGCCLGGSGILADDSTTIASSTISNNVSQQGGGGGILMACGPACNGTLALSNSIVSGNKADAAGGGIALICCNPHTITSSLIEANTAGAFGSTGNTRGGGIYDDDSPLAISLSVIRNNSTPIFGGGVGFDCCGPLTIDTSQVSNNNALSDSGGVDIDDGPAIITNSTLDGNISQGGHGGGIGLFDGPGSLTNVTISGNQAPQGLGGGIFNDLNNTLSLTNVTVANNTAAAGGGIRTGGVALSAKNNLVANNVLQNCLGVTNSQGGNVESTNTCSFTNVALGDKVNANAGIAPLADNGGPVTGPATAPQGAAKTHALLGGSAALDAVPASNCPPPPTDERLLPRPFDGNGDGTPLCDSGAYEAQTILATPTPTSTLTPTSTSTPTPTSTATPTLCILADINCDGIVDILDYGIWRQNFGQIGCGNHADLNGDCVVDIQDYGIWRQNFGHTNRGGGPAAAPLASRPSGTATPRPGPTSSSGTP